MPDPLADLDDLQRAAVMHERGPLVLLGGAGTGKTTMLARRAAWLAQRGLRPDALLVVAPSRAAASALGELIETLVDQPYDELHAYTPHALCARLLREEALEARLDPLFAQLSAADRLALLLEHLDELRLRRHEIRGNPAPLLASFVARIDRLKEEMVTATDYRRYAEGLAPGAGPVSDAERAARERELEFARLFADHDRLLAAAGALDRGDLLLHAFRLLYEKPHVRRRVAERFRHVLVDGYQDMSYAESAVLRLVCDERQAVTVAADDDQATRRARGSAAENVLDFERDHPGASTLVLERSHRSPQRVLAAARAVVEPVEGRLDKPLRGRRGGSVRFWRCASERAQAQAVAGEAERLLTRRDASPSDIAVVVPSLAHDAPAVAAALEERAVPFRLSGGSAYFQRAEIRDLLAWLRLLADPADAGAVVRALSRPPIELRSVDIARVTQLSRRRKLDMVQAVALACEGPQLSPEGRDRSQAFLRLYRAAAGAFEQMRPDAFVHRLIERVGLRRQQLFAAQPDTLERLLNIAKLGELATAFVRREPDAPPRDFVRYVTAVAESGLPEEELAPPEGADAVQVVDLVGAERVEADHVLVLGLSAAAVPGRAPANEDVPAPLLRESGAAEPERGHEQRMRRLLHVAITRARQSVVLAWAERRDGSGRPSPFYEQARAALRAPEESFEEELFGPAEGLHSTFRMMRDELLDSLASLGGRLRELRLDTYVDIDQAIVRYLELVKLAALIERARDGEELEAALRDVNDLLLQAATPEQRQLFKSSALDDYLLDTARDERRRAEALVAEPEPSLERFIPHRGDGLMLSASDVETYRLCPLKYKFSRVYRIPEEPTINQRFGIAVHQVLERYHAQGGGSLEDLMHLFEVAWRRCGFGHSNDELQFRERAVAALARYWELDQEREGEPLFFERSFSFRLGPHVVRGRVDRVDRLPDGAFELIDYKTGKPKSEQELREDIQLSLYQMGAREAWREDGAIRQSYYYVLDNEKVPVEHSEEELERVRSAVAEIADGIMGQSFEPRPSPELCAVCDYRIICPAAER